MSTSPAQCLANRKNAQKSTGPCSPEGKQNVAMNAVSHGIFARQMVLEGETATDFDILLNSLIKEIAPLGALERCLVERIAVSLWRQQRLIRSERAALELYRQPRELVLGVSAALGIRPSSEQAVCEKDLEPVDSEQIDWCNAVIKEIAALDIRASAQDLLLLKRQAPLVYAQLALDAEIEGESMQEHLEQWDQPYEYFLQLLRFCQREVQSAEQNPKVRYIADLVRDRRSILSAEQREKYSRYQTQVDNELYKAIKAIREVQMARSNSHENGNGFVLENASLSLVATDVQASVS